MANQGWQAWLRSETSKQQQRREYVWTKPTRTAAGMGAFYGVVMALCWWAFGSTVASAVVFGLISGALFGPAMVLVLRRKARPSGR